MKYIFEAFKELSLVILCMPLTKPHRTIEVRLDEALIFKAKLIVKGGC